MVQRGSKTGPLGCNGASRCPITAIIWATAAWIFLIQAYTSVFPPPPPPAFSVDEWRLVTDFRRELQRSGPTIENPRFKSSAELEEGRRVVHQRHELAAFYFPDKSLSIDPRAADENERNYFIPGREWRDTEGHPIQAHGGGILYVEETKTYYWYGENKDGRTYHITKRSLARVDVVGVSCYSSKDLWTWKNEGLVLEADKINRSSDLYVSNVVERPKVIFNGQTEQFVMWMHVDNVNYSKASVGVAVSSSPSGPFTYLGSKRPHGHDSRDMTIFKDDNGIAYLIYSSRENSELHIGVLTEDYLDLRKGMRRILVGQRREAPAVFKYKGIYYMVTSGCTGWQPNVAQVHAAESMLGPWETLGDPCIGGQNELRATTFFSQGTFILPLPGFSDSFVFMADRWKPSDLRDSRYVWLPLIVEGPIDEPLDDEFDFPPWQRVAIYWHQRWKLTDGWDRSINKALV